MLTASRVRSPSLSSSSAMVIPDDVPSVAGGPNESGNNFGFHDAIKNVGGIAAAEEESGSGRQQMKNKEDGTRKKREDKPWEERFIELAAYKEKNGNCSVPQKQDALGSWVNNQRTIHRKGKLSREHTAQLEGIGFIWGAERKKEKAKTWAKRMKELVAFKVDNGTCNVPQRQSSLGYWVDNQRKLHKKGKLSQECTTQLEDIGFNWGMQRQKSDEQWEKRIKELAVYKEKTGNCNVPQSQGALGRWVHKQRNFYNKGKLSQERTTQLEGIGFVWKLNSGSKKPSTPVQSDLTVDGSHEEAGRGSIESGRGMSNSGRPALPLLPSAQADMDSE